MTPIDIAKDYIRAVQTGDQSVVRRGPDAATRAKLRGEEETVGPRLLGRDAQLLKDHLMKRRQFLLGQQELQDGGRGSR